VFPFYFANRFSGAVVHLTTDGKHRLPSSSVFKNALLLQIKTSKRQNARISELTRAF
jgi:hypothetical protein